MSNNKNAVPVFFTCTSCNFGTISQLYLNHNNLILRDYEYSSIYDLDEFCFTNHIFHIQCSVCDKEVTSTQLLGFYRRYMERNYPKLLDEYFLDSILERLYDDIVVFVDAKKEMDRIARGRRLKMRQKLDDAKFIVPVDDSSVFTTNISKKMDELTLRGDEDRMENQLSVLYKHRVYENTVEVDLTDGGMKNYITKVMAHYNTLVDHLRFDELQQKYYLFNNYIRPAEIICQRFKTTVNSDNSNNSNNSDRVSCYPIVELPQLASVHLKRDRFHYKIKLANDGSNQRRIQNFQHRFWKCNREYKCTHNDMDSTRIWMLERHKSGFREVIDWQNHSGDVYVTFSKITNFPNISEGAKLGNVVFQKSL